MTDWTYQSTISVPEQQALFLESDTDAVRALGMRVGWKVLACRMRPELGDDPDRAARWLNDALNDDKRDVLHALHLRRALKLGREHECHVLNDFIEREAGYEAKPIAAKSRRMQLLEEDARIVEQIRQATARRIEIEHEFERIQQAELLGDIREAS